MKFLIYRYRLSIRVHSKYISNINSKNIYVYHTKLSFCNDVLPISLYLAEPAGSISMVENELFDVIEYDQGDGWTRVRRKEFNTDDDDFIGFVPTSYISINMELYPNQ